MFSAMVPVKRNGSCSTTPKCCRNFVRSCRRTSTSSISTWPLLHIVEAHHQRNDGGLAGAGVADNRGRLVRFDGEADAFQDPFNFRRERGSDLLRIAVRNGSLLLV